MSRYSQKSGKRKTAKGMDDEEILSAMGAETPVKKTTKDARNIGRNSRVKKTAESITSQSQIETNAMLPPSGTKNKQSKLLFSGGKLVSSEKGNEDNKVDEIRQKTPQKLKTTEKVARDARVDPKMSNKLPMIKLLDVNQFSTPVQKTTKRKEDINADHIAGKKGNQDGRSNDHQSLNSKTKPKNVVSPMQQSQGSTKFSQEKTLHEQTNFKDTRSYRRRFTDITSKPVPANESQKTRNKQLQDNDQSSTREESFLKQRPSTNSDSGFDSTVVQEPDQVKSSRKQRPLPPTLTEMLNEFVGNTTPRKVPSIDPSDTDDNDDNNGADNINNDYMVRDLEEKQDESDDEGSQDEKSSVVSSEYDEDNSAEDESYIPQKDEQDSDVSSAPRSDEEDFSDAEEERVKVAGKNDVTDGDDELSEDESPEIVDEEDRTDDEEDPKAEIALAGENHNKRKAQLVALAQKKIRKSQPGPNSLREMIRSQKELVAIVRDQAAQLAGVREELRLHREEDNGRYTKTKPPPEVGHHLRLACKASEKKWTVGKRLNHRSPVNMPATNFMISAVKCEVPGVKMCHIEMALRSHFTTHRQEECRKNSKTYTVEEHKKYNRKAMRKRTNKCAASIKSRTSFYVPFPGLYIFNTMDDSMLELRKRRDALHNPNYFSKKAMAKLDNYVSFDLMSSEDSNAENRMDDRFFVKTYDWRSEKLSNVYNKLDTVVRATATNMSLRMKWVRMEGKASCKKPPKRLNPKHWTLKQLE